MSRIEPTEDRILVRPDADQDQKTPAGIIKPTVAKDAPMTGMVIATGPEARALLDQHIIHGKFSGTQVEHEGEVFLIMRRSDVLGRYVPDGSHRLPEDYAPVRVS